MAATIQKKRKTLDGPTLHEWLYCVTGMFILFSAACLPDIGPVPLFRAFSLFFLRSIRMVRMVFNIASAAHVGEAIYAWYLAKRVDPANAKRWFWQTSLLGFFSLRYLLKKARK